MLRFCIIMYTTDVHSFIEQGIKTCLLICCIVMSENEAVEVFLRGGGGDEG